MWTDWDVLTTFIRHTDEAISELRHGNEELRQQLRQGNEEMRQANAEMRQANEELRQELRQSNAEWRQGNEEPRRANEEFRQQVQEDIADMRQWRLQAQKQWGEIANKLGSFVEDIVAPNSPRIPDRSSAWTGSRNNYLRRHGCESRIRTILPGFVNSITSTPRAEAGSLLSQRMIPSSTMSTVFVKCWPR